MRLSVGRQPRSHISLLQLKKSVGSMPTSASIALLAVQAVPAAAAAASPAAAVAPASQPSLAVSPLPSGSPRIRRFPLPPRRCLLSQPSSLSSVYVDRSLLVRPAAQGGRVAAAAGGGRSAPGDRRQPASTTAAVATTPAGRLPAAPGRHAAAQQSPGFSLSAAADGAARAAPSAADAECPDFIGPRELGSSIADFTRYYEDPSGQQVELQTAVVTYVKADERQPWWDVLRLRPRVQVDLVSVVHIGDKEYYDGLQRDLGAYDRVLYEMVADKGSSSSSSSQTSFPNTEVSAQGNKSVMISSRFFGRAPTSESSSSSSLTASSAPSSWVAFLPQRVNDKEEEEGRWRPPKRSKGKKRRKGAIGTIQSALSSALRLTFQLDCIDYRADNFYHADLDYQTFKQLQKERNETFLSFAREVAVRSTKAVLRASSVPPSAPRSDSATVGPDSSSIDQQRSAAERRKAALAAAVEPVLVPVRGALLWAARFVPMPLVGLLLIETVCAPAGATPLAELPAVRALMNLDFATALKVFLAQQISMDAVDSAANVMESSVIIGERNKAAMVELHAALDAGCRRVAIFYGSGHLPDLHRRLRQELNMLPVSVSWRSAWRIRGMQRNKGSLGEMEEVVSAVLARMAEVSGWPLNRYQTTALLLMSVLLALDLWLWELVLAGAQEWAVHTLVFVGHFLDRGWGL